MGQAYVEVTLGNTGILDDIINGFGLVVSI